MAQLEETFDFMEFYTMKNDVDKMLNINVKFHQKIYKASHNRMLQHLLSSYQAYIRHGRRNFDEKEEYLQTVLKEHRDIFQAFIENDVEAGVRAMEIHMDHSKNTAIMIPVLLILEPHFGVAYSLPEWFFQ
jgi:DNA-binding GntR family transcriptional regulator